MNLSQFFCACLLHSSKIQEQNYEPTILYRERNTFVPAAYLSQNHFLMPITINRRNIRFLPDPSRVIVRFLYLEPARSLNVIRAVLGLSESDVTYVLGQVLRNFSLRHRNISKIFEKNYNRISSLFTQMSVDPESLSFSRKLLIGSSFTMEYAIESAAFFNPSIIEHPDQTSLRRDEKRVIISFRATGEGHISSIVFRTGFLIKTAISRLSRQER